MGGISQEQAATIAKRGRVLKPRMLVEVGGLDPCDPLIPPAPTIEAKYAKSMVVQKGNYLGVDRFKCVCALGVDQDYSFWSELLGCSLNLKLRYDGEIDVGVGDWIQIFRGIADDIDVDCFRGEVTISGRNNAAPMIDAQIKAGTFNNVAKVDVIRDLAEQYGLTVEFGATEPEGDFGNEVHEDRAHQAFGAQTTDIRVWDVVTRIAQETGRTSYVKDDVLHVHDVFERDVYVCQAPFREYDATGKVCKLGPTNSTALRFNHNFMLIKYNVVIGIHHNQHDAKVNLYQFPEDACEAAKKNPSVIHMVNKNEDDAKLQTEAYAKQRSGFEWTIEWTTTGPEILDIEVADLIEVVGTNSEFDGEYKISSIEHNINFERGLLTTITGKFGQFDDVEAAL